MTTTHYIIRMAILIVVLVFFFYIELRCQRDDLFRAKVDEFCKRLIGKRDED